MPISPAGAHPTTKKGLKLSSTSPAETEDSVYAHSATSYRWIEGTCLKEYGTSAVKWKKHTATPEFTEAFQTIMQTYAE
jgi:hypothetical protein